MPKKVDSFFPETMEKICTSCKLKKSVNEFPKDKKSWNGYWHYCKECKNKRSKKARLKLSKTQNEKKLKEILEKYPGVFIDEQNIKTLTNRKSFSFPDTNEKICSKCELKKKVEEFYKDSSSSSQDGYEGVCKECNFQYQKKTIAKRYSTFEGRIVDFLRNAKNNSKRRGMKLSISGNDLKELWEKQNRKCYYTGLEMNLPPNTNMSVSIDRTNPEIGYEKNNIKLVCNVVNRLKSDLNERFFLEICSALLNFKKKNKVQKNSIWINKNVYKVPAYKQSEEKMNIKSLSIKHPDKKASTSKFSNSSKKAFYFPETQEKLCGYCGIIKKIENFYKHSGTADGHHTWCNICCNQGNKRFLEKSYSSFEKRIKRTFGSSKASAIKRKIYFDIKIEDVVSIWKKQKELCYYTGVKMTIQPVNNNTVSIERINSEVGYVKDNIVLVCHIVNIMKSDFDVDYFFSICEKVLIHSKKLISA